MKATHKLTHLPTGDEYLTNVQGDDYYVTWPIAAYSGPFRGFRVNFLNNDRWLVEKISTFKGNK